MLILQQYAIFVIMYVTKQVCFDTVTVVVLSCIRYYCKMQVFIYSIDCAGHEVLDL